MAAKAWGREEEGNGIMHDSPSCCRLQCLKLQASALCSQRSWMIYSCRASCCLVCQTLRGQVRLGGRQEHAAARRAPQSKQATKQGRSHGIGVQRRLGGLPGRHNS